MTIRPEHFTHLHAHSCYSFKDGSIPIRTLVDKQVGDGARAVACTDHGNMTSSWFLYDYIHNVKNLESVKHIIGLEAYLSLTRDELFAWLPNASDIDDKDERKRQRDRLGKRYHQILLCKNLTGYKNAIRIHNEAWQNGFYYAPMTTKQMIFDNHEGIIATTTCLASVWCQYIMAGNFAAAEREIMEWKEVFGEDFFVELQPTNYETQRMVNIELIRLAKKTNTPMVITNDVHYIESGDAKLHFTLLNLDTLKKRADGDDTGRLWEFEVDDLYLKSLDEMKDSWAARHKGKEFTLSVFEECVHNVSSIIDRVEHYTLESKPHLPKCVEGDSFEALKRRVVSSFVEKVKTGAIPANRIEEYKERLRQELKVIHALGAEDYIHLCALIMDWCKEKDITTGIGRGSAAGSLVLWLTGVTGVDPIKYNLLFERFLTMNRRVKLVM